MPRITNHQVRAYVERKEPFVTGNKTIWAENYTSPVTGAQLYVVYSYDRHFPMYVYDYGTQTWFGNESKYSRTTTTHQSKARPIGIYIEWCFTPYLIALIRAGGYAAHCARRVITAEGTAA